MDLELSDTNRNSHLKTKEAFTSAPKLSSQLLKLICLIFHHINTQKMCLCQISYTLNIPNSPSINKTNDHATKSVVIPTALHM